LEDVLPDVLDEVGEGGLPGVHLDDLDAVDDLAHEADAHVRLVRRLHAQVPDLIANPGCGRNSRNQRYVTVSFLFCFLQEVFYSMFSCRFEKPSLVLSIKVVTPRTSVVQFISEF
jgi:hypothetical protein